MDNSKYYWNNVKPAEQYAKLYKVCPLEVRKKIAEKDFADKVKALQK